MMRITSMMIGFLLVVCCCASSQELDPDTLELASSSGWIDALMLDVVPGSSIMMRTSQDAGSVSLRALVDHASYTAGLLRTASLGERPFWWAFLRGKGWSAGIGDIIVEAGLGSVLSAARGMGRSRLSPAGSEARPARGGAGGLRGATATYRLDTSRVLHVAVGLYEPLQEDVAAVWHDTQLWGIRSTFTTLLRNTDAGTKLIVSVAARKLAAPFEAGAELSLDGDRQLAMQAFLSARRPSYAASMSMWYADPACDLPLGSVLATADRVVNTWGGMVRLRATRRGLFTARCSITMFGRPWRTGLLPMASSGFDIVADVEQRITDRLVAQWRLGHRHDQDGVSFEQRRQLQRRTWTARLRLHRTISTSMQVRMNIDVRAVRLGNEPWSMGSFGWVDLCWRLGARTTLRMRGGIHAAQSTDAAVTSVEYASQGLQTIVRGLGWGRRVSVGVEWRLSTQATVALQAAAESRLHNAVYASDASLRCSLHLRLESDRAIMTSALPEDGRPEPHE